MGITIGKHLIGHNEAPYIIAEISGNHNGSLDRAIALIDAIAETGAHAVKFQTYTPDTITIDCDTPDFTISDNHELWAGQTLYQLYEQAHTPWEWHETLFEHATNRGLTAFSSPFDATAIELLEKLDTPAYKIASSEIVDLELIQLAAHTGKPIIISTGMATLAEIDTAVNTAKDTGNTNIIVLACTASYPAPASDSNLNRIPALRTALGTHIGLSDHTPGIGVPIAAVALGATVIEKHVTLDRQDGGVDSAFSLTPTELTALVVETERAHAATGNGVVGPVASETEGLRFRRSLYITADVEVGDIVTRDNIRSIRPAHGLAPQHLPAVLGRRFTKSAKRGTPLSWDLM